MRTETISVYQLSEPSSSRGDMRVITNMKIHHTAYPTMTDSIATGPTAMETMIKRSWD